MYRFFISLLMLCGFLSENLSAQNPQPAFRNFTTDDGLPSSEAYFVFQDSKGFIWIATDNGLSRFDGYHFKHFSSSNGLLDPVVFYLSEDQQGRIWMNTLSKDIYYYENDSIYPYRYNHLIQKHHSVQTINRDFYITVEGTLYSNIPNSGLLEIKKNGSHRILEPTQDGSHLIVEVEGIGIYKSISAPDSLKALFQKKYTDKGILPDFEVYNDSNKRIVGIPRNEPGFRFSSVLHTLEPHAYLFFHSAHMSYLKDGDLIWDYPYSRRVTKNGVFRDDQGQLLLGAINGEGLMIYEDLADLIDGKGLYTLDGFSITSILKDRKGGYWFSTLEQGVFYTPAFNLMIYDQRFGLSGDLIMSVSIKNDHSFWIALRNGDLFEINSNNHQFKKLPPSKLDTENWDLLYDAERDVLWNGSTNLNYFENGVWAELKEEAKNGKIPMRNEEVGNKRMTLSRDGKYLWGAGRVGFVKVDLDTKKIVENSRDYGIDQRIFVVFEDQSQRVWVGNERGLFEFSKGQLIPPQIKHKALSLRIEDIDQMADSTLVIGTKGEGVVLLKGDSLRVINERQGLSSNMIENVFVDHKNQLWIGTLLGLNKITIDESGVLKIAQTTTAHGLPSNEINKVKSYGDDLLIATSKGLARLFLNQESAPIDAPILGDMIVNNKLVKIRPNLELTHQQNNIEFNYFAIDFEQAGQITYRYKLKPLIDQWIYTPNRSLSNSALMPNEYQFEVQSKDKDGNWSESTHFDFEILPPFWQLWWFRLLTFLLVMGLAWAFYRNRLNQLSKENEIKQKMFDLERAALRSQMNPHFIFNVLSSIQYFILNDDKKAATSYLSRFARLVRTTLNHSRESKITLENEIQVLENYLVLEKMRFKDQFEYNIEVDPSLIDLDIEIPPMLIQPYLENALIHGIAPKKKDGLIEVVYTPEQSYLHVMIKDNGIGINRSKQLKERKKKGYDSIGMDITKQRLELMNKGTRKDVVVVQELKNLNEEITGTCVNIWIQLDK